jgi:hypothetical protein
LSLIKQAGKGQVAHGRKASSPEEGVRCTQYKHFLCSIYKYVNSGVQSSLVTWRGPDQISQSASRLVPIRSSPYAAKSHLPRYTVEHRAPDSRHTQRTRLHAAMFIKPVGDVLNRKGTQTRGALLIWRADMNMIARACFLTVLNF